MKITISSLLHLKLTKEPCSDSYMALGLSDCEAKYNDFERFFCCQQKSILPEHRAELPETHV